MPGMLVNPKWLQKVDDKINAEDNPKRLNDKDLTYVVRPAKLTSAWSSGKAAANLIINGSESTSIDVYDATGQADSVGLTTGDYCYVAYRGQWEIISSFVQGGGSADQIMYGTVTSLIQNTATPRYYITGSDGNTYDVALTIYPTTLLIIGKKAVFCVPADGSQAWLINTESA